MRRLLLPLLFLLQIPLAAMPAVPALSVRLTPPRTVGADLRGSWRVTFTNRSATPVVALPFVLYTYTDSISATLVTFPEGATCTQGYPGSASCTVDVPANGTRELIFVAQHRSALGHFFAGVEATSPSDGVRLVEQDEVVIGRPYLVRNADDSGPGSLRQAIRDVNRECSTAEPCAIEFAIDGPVPAAGWFTIRPQSPLPGISAPDVVIDGRSQTEHTGDTNPSGPEIALNGSDAAEGHGLEFSGTMALCDSLAIGGFPGNGVASTAAFITVRRSYLGTDATGLKALPNGLRGVRLTGGRALIRDNVLSGNRRAGGYIHSDGSVTVRDNLIGVGADGVTPLGNGASGLFFHRNTLNYDAAFATGNVIAYNAHAGIALSTMAVGGFNQNRFHDNGGAAIDVGIDGPSRGVGGVPGMGGVVGAPVITSARYENGVTTIQVSFGEGASGTTAYNSVAIYASDSLEADGTAEGSELLGTADSFPGPLELKVPGDLRGKYVNASTYAIFIYGWDSPAPGTSELGLPRLVE
jgi:hypothetical protein